jgi:hypothetical protein
MKFNHNSRHRRTLLSRYRTYRAGHRVSHTYLRGQPLGHSLVVLLLVVGVGISGLAYAGAESGGDEPRQPVIVKRLPLLADLKTQPLPQLPKRQTTLAKGSAGAGVSPLASFSHTTITTTVFWVGEPSDSENAFIPNNMSVWDEHWQANYGGVDDPTHRNGSNPASFTPRENPFYIALPYSDITEGGQRKASAANCQNAQTKAASPYSWCKNTWIAIRHNGQVVYGQWQDAGPLGEDDTAYVFGAGTPKNTFNAHAGLDVSPAIKDYLGLQDIDHTDWMFIAESQVPSGPWKNIITTSTGDARIN